MVLCVQKGAFPSYLNVGTDAYRNAYILITNSFWHSNYPNSEDWQKLLKLMHQEFLLGTIETFLITNLEDAYYRINNLPLRYGIISDIFNPYLFNPYDDIYPSIEELNKNRKEAGLAPFELEVKAMNIDLNTLIIK